MDKKQPERLRNDQYFLQRSTPFRIFRQSLHEHFEVHWHEFYELTIVLSGTGVNVVNGEACPLYGGSLFLLTPADFHEIAPSPGDCLEVYNLIFSEDMLSEECRDLLFRRGCDYAARLDDPLAQSVTREFVRIMEEWEQPRIGSRTMVRGALERIILELLRRLEAADAFALSQSAARADPVQRALTYIQHRFREPITLEDAARQAGLAPTYFSQQFRSRAGIPFQKYLQEQRLAFAYALLAATSLPVTEICYASGFNTLTHFERAFKLKYGCSPRAAKRRQS